MITPENLEWLKKRGIEPSDHQCTEVQCMFDSVAKEGRLSPRDVITGIHTPRGLRVLLQCPRCKTISTRDAF